MIEGSLWVPMRAFARRGIDKEERGRARLGGCVRRAPRQPNATIYFAASGPRNRRLDGGTISNIACAVKLGGLRTRGCE
jgi:hypothetical protein